MTAEFVSKSSKICAESDLFAIYIHSNEIHNVAALSALHVSDRNGPKHVELTPEH